MHKFKDKFNVAKKAAHPLPKKEILWAGQDGGCNYFPKSKVNIMYRKNAIDPIPLTAFRDAVIKAQERIWMVDEYLFVSDKGKSNNRIQTLSAWLQDDINANDIRLLTKHHEEIHADALDKFKQRTDAINNYRSHSHVKCNIKIKTNLSNGIDYLHDRFAIIDDELWHFGATVGGFHSSVNAVSRGWRASEHGAIDFFELLWNEGE